MRFDKVSGRFCVVVYDVKDIPMKIRLGYRVEPNVNVSIGGKTKEMNATDCHEAQSQYMPTSSRAVVWEGK